VDPGHVLFAHVAARPDEEIDLAAATLLVAEAEYPGLDIPHYLTLLDDMAEGVRGRLTADAVARPGRPALDALNAHLFQDLGFRGNDEDYYDPRNSFLNEVIDRRVGIPISLSVLYLEVGRRLGLDLVGISFPGHFLVMWRGAGDEDPLLVDPYHRGVALAREVLEERLETALGKGTALAAEHLQPATSRQILTRILNNLRGIYQRSGDGARERGVLERLAILNPKDERVEAALDALRKGGGAAN
jgi:regulator of sirC expression with transglutaminase-like and TPR domain